MELIRFFHGAFQLCCFERILETSGKSPMSQSTSFSSVERGPTSAPQSTVCFIRATTATLAYWPFSTTARVNWYQNTTVMDNIGNNDDGDGGDS